MRGRFKRWTKVKKKNLVEIIWYNKIERFELEAFMITQIKRFIYFLHMIIESFVRFPLL